MHDVVDVHRVLVATHVQPWLKVALVDQLDVVGQAWAHRCEHRLVAVERHVWRDVASVLGVPVVSAILGIHHVDVSVVLQSRAEVLHHRTVAHEEVAVGVRSHARDAGQVDEVRSNVILQIQGAAFVHVVGVRNGHRAVGAKVVPPVLQAIGPWEVAKVAIHRVCVGVVHAAVHAVHGAVGVNVHVACTVRVQVLGGDAIAVKVDAQAVGQTRVDGVEVYREVGQHLVLPVVPCVVRNHDEAVAQVVEHGKRHHASVGVDAVGVGADVDEVRAVQFREGGHFPSVSAVHGAVVQQGAVLALVFKPTIGHRGGNADDVNDFVVDAPHGCAWPKVAHGVAVVEDGVVRQIRIFPRACAGVTAHHVEGRVDACVADDDFSAVTQVVDGRPANADVFDAFVWLLAPTASVVEIVASASVLKRRHVQAHGPSRADCRTIARHAVVNGCVGLQVVLGDADDLTFNHQIARLHVVVNEVVGPIDGRLRAVIDVQDRVGRHGGFHPLVDRDLWGIQNVLLGKRWQREQNAGGQEGKMFHEINSVCASKVSPCLGTTKFRPGGSRVLSRGLSPFGRGRRERPNPAARTRRCGSQT